MRNGTAIRIQESRKMSLLVGTANVDKEKIEKRKKLFFKSSTTQKNKVEKRKNGKQLSEKEKRLQESAQAKEIFINYKLRANLSLPQQIELVKKLTPEDATDIVTSNHANGFHIELSVRIAITSKAHENGK